MEEYVGYRIVCERMPHNWGAYSPDVPGLIVTGQTREEVEQWMQKLMPIQAASNAAAEAQHKARMAQLRADGARHCCDTRVSRPASRSVVTPKPKPRPRLKKALIR